MKIDDYFDKIATLWPEPNMSPRRELMDWCMQGVAEHPNSSTLWYDLGVLMQRCDESYGYKAEDYLRCFENAIHFNAQDAEAHQELGYVLDIYLSEYERAYQAFAKAIELGAEHESYCGRARVLAQMGKTQEAIDSISENACRFHKHPAVQSLRSEILNGTWDNPGGKKGIVPRSLEKEDNAHEVS
jgi:uncharacterized protein HemY